MSAGGPLQRIRARLRRPAEIARAAALPSAEREPGVEDARGSRSPELGEPLEDQPPEPAPPEEDRFEHAPDATPDEVPSPRKVGFDGREIPERGPQSGHSPGGMGAGGV